MTRLGTLPVFDFSRILANQFVEKLHLALAYLLGL